MRMPRLPTVRLNVLISLLVASTVIVTLGVALWMFDATLRDTQEDAQAARVTDIAQVVASRRRVVNVLKESGDTRDFATDSDVQREIDALRQRLDVDFIVVMTPHAMRLTHPDPTRIGEHFQGGDEGPALQSEARERDITLTVDVEDTIPAPRAPAMIHTLVIVLGNLLENAFDAVDEQHERHVTLTMGVDAALLSLHVQDTGPGIPEAMREHVFASGTSSKGRQRGLGLTMVREHVEAHDGTLALYSEPGRGTLIEVALPYPVSSTTEN